MRLLTLSSNVRLSHAQHAKIDGGAVDPEMRCVQSKSHPDACLGAPLFRFHLLRARLLHYARLFRVRLVATRRPCFTFL